MCFHGGRGRKEQARERRTKFGDTRGFPVGMGSKVQVPGEECVLEGREGSVSLTSTQHGQDFLEVS